MPRQKRAAAPATAPNVGYEAELWQMADALRVAVRFCDRYISLRSRTHDQMVQAARSGVQNIAEGSQASGTSKKMELKLTSVDGLVQAGGPLSPFRPRRPPIVRSRRMRRWSSSRWRAACSTASWGRRPPPSKKRAASPSASRSGAKANDGVHEWAA